MSARDLALACTAGVLFAIGLALAGMLDTANVVGFLDVAGDFRPRLALVMGGAIAVFAPVYEWSLRREPETVRVHLPLRDPKLFAGAILFGIGWALVGYCPGPSLVSLGAAFAGVETQKAVLFFAAMVAGMALHHVVTVLAARRATREDG